MSSFFGFEVVDLNVLANNLERHQQMKNIDRFLVDPECFRLAEHFLPENAPKQVKDDLAKAIQYAVEDHLVGVNCEVKLIRAAPVGGTTP